MKGIVFTEFLDMVEDQFGMVTLDEIISKSELETGGAYTAIGTYKHSEMVQLVVNLSNSTQIPVPDLLQVYGKHFFGILVKSYPVFFENITSLLDFLEQIEKYIHPEVLKLYPDAELPHFQSERPNANELVMTYHSTRKMSDFAEGLIRGAMVHFDEEYTVNKKMIEEDGSIVQFHLKK